MSHMRLLITASIIACVVIIGFVLSVPHTRDIAQTSASDETVIVPSVTLHDSFKKGMHTITGSLEAPNACIAVTASAAVSNNASGEESIRVAISMPTDVGVCLQLLTRINFSTTISAPAHMSLSATVNGREASTTVL